eukprot:11183252-Lingulodinium_polyedra.AAC.1
MDAPRGAYIAACIIVREAELLIWTPKPGAALVAATFAFDPEMDGSVARAGGAAESPGGARA